MGKRYLMIVKGNKIITKTKRILSFFLVNFAYIDLHALSKKILVISITPVGYVCCSCLYNNTKP